MLPCENSLAGRVPDIHSLLPESGLHIVGEHFQRVEHCLLGIPGTAIGDIRRIHSHAVALGQVRGIVRELGAQAVIEADTAGSAQLIAEWGRPADAAIASALAAEIYGLDILRANVEDAAHNTTRFYIAAQQADWPQDAPGTVTTFIFRVKNVPAALYKALGGFATNGGEHDQAGKLHGVRPVHRDAVPLRRGRPPGPARPGARAGGAGILLP